MVKALVRAGLIPRRVEDVELGLRPEVHGVGDPGATQVVLGLAGDVARVPGIGLAGQRVVDEEGQVQRLVCPEWVEYRGGRIRQQEHVRLVDLLEAAYRRAIEHPALGEDVRIERLGRHGEVLYGAGQV